MPAFAVGGVADDRVADMLQMAAQLVAAACVRLQRHQGIAAAWVAVNRDWQLHRGQPLVAGERWLRCSGLVADGFAIVVLPAERVVNFASRRRPAAHDRQIMLVHLLVLKCLRQRSPGLRAQAKQQDSRGALVQPMHRVHMPAELVAHGLHGKAGFVRALLHGPAFRAEEHMIAEKAMALLQDFSRDHGTTACTELLMKAAQEGVTKKVNCDGLVIHMAERLDAILSA